MRQTERQGAVLQGCSWFLWNFKFSDAESGINVHFGNGIEDAVDRAAQGHVSQINFYGVYLGSFVRMEGWQPNGCCICRGSEIDVPRSGKVFAMFVQTAEDQLLTEERFPLYIEPKNCALLR